MLVLQALALALAPRAPLAPALATRARAAAPPGWQLEPQLRLLAKRPAPRPGWRRQDGNHVSAAQGGPSDGASDARLLGARVLARRRARAPAPRRTTPSAPPPSASTPPAAARCGWRRGCARSLQRWRGSATRACASRRRPSASTPWASTPSAPPNVGVSTPGSSRRCSRLSQASRILIQRRMSRVSTTGQWSLPSRSSRICTSATAGSSACEACTEGNYCIEGATAPQPCPAAEAFHSRPASGRHRRQRVHLLSRLHPRLPVGSDILRVDAGARRNDAEVVERALTLLEELVALDVALVLAVNVHLESARVAKCGGVTFDGAILGAEADEAWVD